MVPDARRQGSVYHTLESASALGKFHRNCDCKIVPNCEGDRYVLLVEGHDLWTHHVLEQNGIKTQTHGAADIDLSINVEWWEGKSPKPIGVSARDGGSLSFIERNLRRASHQFRDRGHGGARVVLNLRYRHAASDDVLIRETKRRMAMHGVAEVLFIKSDGSLEHLYK